MDKENGIRLAITGALGLFCAYFQVLVIPLIIMAVLMAVDYITGLTKAYINGDISSRTGVKGILKKVGYFFIVVGAMVIDYLLKSTLISAGIILPENFTVALLVIIWLILNELISILENLAIIGVPMPQFLIKIVKKLKVVAEEKGEISGETEGK